MSSMNITIKATGFELTEAISAHVTEKFGMLEKHIHERGSTTGLVQVEVGRTTNHHKNGDVFRAEATVVVGGATYRAEHTTTDLYAAVDVVKDSLVDKLSRDNTKKTGMMRRGARRFKEMVRGIRMPKMPKLPKFGKKRTLP